MELYYKNVFKGITTLKAKDTREVRSYEIKCF